jgi:hypothetical protein
MFSQNLKPRLITSIKLTVLAGYFIKAAASNQGFLDKPNLGLEDLQFQKIASRGFVIRGSFIL